MHRVPDWQQRLEVFIATNRTRVFRYGDWDCFQFARQAVLAMTGTDMAVSFRSYTSRFGYHRQMRSYSDSLSIVAFAEKLTASLGCIEVPVDLAGRGDITLVNESDPAFALIALNGRSALALSLCGEIQRLPLSSVIASWRV